MDVCNAQIIGDMFLNPSFLPSSITTGPIKPFPLHRIAKQSPDTVHYSRSRVIRDTLSSTANNNKATMRSALLSCFLLFSSSETNLRRKEGGMR